MEHDTGGPGLGPAGDEEPESAEAVDQDEALKPDEVAGGAEPDEVAGGAEPDEVAGGAEPDEVDENLDVFEPDDLPEPAEASWVDEPSAGTTRSTAQRQATGEPRVDEALHRLDELAELPVAGHPAVFEHVHARLRDVLGELDTGSLAGAQGRQGS